MDRKCHYTATPVNRKCMKSVHLLSIFLRCFPWTLRSVHCSYWFRHLREPLRCSAKWHDKLTLIWIKFFQRQHRSQASSACLAPCKHSQVFTHQKGPLNEGHLSQSRAGVKLQHVKPLLIMPTSRGGVLVQISTAHLLNQLPANAPRKIEKDDLSTWARVATHIRDLDEVPGPALN